MKNLIILLLFICSISASAQDMLIQDSIKINLKSGNELTAIVVRKKDQAAPLPAIIRYSIYASPEIDKAMNSIAALKGYVGVTVYTRGKYLSPQEVKPFAHDAEDAWEMIDWVSKQSWCDGKVGMYGASYLGFSQWAAVKKLHPALKTIVPQSSVGIGIDFPMHNNINMGYGLQWLHYVTNNKNMDPKDFADNKHWSAVYNKLYTSGAAFDQLDSLEGRPNALFREWIRHPGYDGYWKQMTPSDQDYAKLNIPVLTIAGYYDVDQSGALYYFRKHYQQNPKADHYLVLGPYDHAGLQGRIMPELKGYRLDSVAMIKVYGLTFGWFDHILKGAAKPALLQDRVNYEVMGANRWEHASSLQALQQKKLTFYLGTKQVHNRYSLDWSPEQAAKGITRQIDFRDRTDTLSANADYGLVDTVLHLNKGMVVFESAPFTETTDIAGTLSGELQLIVNKKDVDLAIQLYEQMPDGRYLQLNDDLFRASYAKDRSKRQLLHPGKVETIPLINKTFFISRQIAKGSRLILVLGVNRSAGYEVNYGSGKKVSAEAISDGKEDMVIQFLPKSFIDVPVR